jgi:predicted XRE-type DNA-binding protein
LNATITLGTGNVFADLGLPGAAERQTKTRLAMSVNGLLDARQLKQREAAQVLGIPQPKVSALRTCLRSRRGRAGAGLGGLRRCNPCQWHGPLAADRALQPIPIRIPHTSRRDRKHVLRNYRLDQFSVEKLMEFLTALNHDVEIRIRPRAAAGMGHIAVLALP